MRHLPIFPTWLAILLLCPAFGFAAGPEIPLPASTLNAQQIETLFSGYTAAANTPDGKDQELVTYFGKDGKVEQAQKGFIEKGKWYVREDARLCVDLKGEKRDCRIIVKDGDAYRQYAVKLDGNHNHELTWVEFRKGKHLARMSTAPLLPEGTLDHDQVVALFNDRTVESVTADKGRVSRTYYAPDGSVDQLRNGKHRRGKWRVTKNGRICLQMEGRSEKCRIIVKEKGEYHKYIVKKNGHHQHSVSYRSFVAGNQL